MLRNRALKLNGGYGRGERLAPMGDKLISTSRLERRHGKAMGPPPAQQTSPIHQTTPISTVPASKRLFPPPKRQMQAKLKREHAPQPQSLAIAPPVGRANKQVYCTLSPPQPRKGKPIQQCGQNLGVAPAGVSGEIGPPPPGANANLDFLRQFRVSPLSKRPRYTGLDESAKDTVRLELAMLQAAELIRKSESDPMVWNMTIDKDLEMVLRGKRLPIRTDKLMYDC